jgi:hypothetical protein
VKKALMITDLTRMQHGRVCLAGYDTDLCCIRPVLPHPGIQEESLRSHGKALVFPSAVVEFDFGRLMPQPPHTEDIEYSERSVRFVERLSEKHWRDLLVDTLSKNVATIFGQPIHTGPGHHVMEGQGNRSLGTIVPQRVTRAVFRRRDDGKWEYRLAFVDGDGMAFELAVTDLAWQYRLDRVRAQSHSVEQICGAFTNMLQRRGVFLRIGLARRWDKHPSKCFLQITGIHTFPDYLDGLTFADISP